MPESNPVTPAAAGETLHADEEVELLDVVGHSKYRSGVGKLLHLAKWSRVEMLNRVRELSRFMSKPNVLHWKAMLRAMKYAVNTANRGVLLRPNRKWDGKDKSFEFIVSGMADADYAANLETRRSVSGYSTFLEGSVITTKSKMQTCVTLSTTESEFVSMTECAQDMLFTMRVLQSLELKVKFPMVLQCDNKGACDLANNWSAGGRTRHVATKIMFLRELKEEGLLAIEWVSNTEMVSDLFTKTLGDKDFKKCAKAFVGLDEYD